MSPQLVAALANILACQARVLGYQAENEQAKIRGDAVLPFNSQAFNAEAWALDNLSIEVRNS